MNFGTDESGNLFNRQDRRSTRLEALNIYNFAPPIFLALTL
jgi:hypothetical protein